MGHIWVIGLLLFNQAKATENWTLNSVVHQALESSPLIVNQKIQYDLSERDRWRRFIFNEPQLQYTNSDDKSDQSLGVQLPVGIPGKAFALSELDTAKAHSQKNELDAKRYDVARTYSQAYLDCATAQAVEVMQKETTNDLETVYKSMKASYESGHGTQAEKIGSALQARQAANDLQTATDKKNSSCRKLQRLLGETSATELPVLSLDDDIDAQTVAELGGRTSDQGRAASGMEVAKATENTAWWSQVPDLNLSVTRNHYVYLPASPSGHEWTTTYGVGITIPLFFPFYEGAEGKRAKAQARIDYTTAELQKVGADADQADAAAEYQRSKKRLVELRKTDLVLAEALLDSTYSAYRSGKLGYAELVLARKTLMDLKNQDIQLRNSIIMAHLRCLQNCEAANGEKGTLQ